MTAPFITVKFLNWKKVQKDLADFAEDLQPTARKAFGESALKRVKKPPKRKIVSRAAAYPQEITIDYGPHRGKTVQGYFSSKQYYKVLMLAKEGKIPYKRKGNQARGWRYNDPNLENSVPSAVYTMGQKKQSRHEALVGWEKTKALIERQYGLIMRDVNKAVAKFIKSRNLQ